jgi:hypothetical protein
MTTRRQAEAEKRPARRSRNTGSVRRDEPKRGEENGQQTPGTGKHGGTGRNGADNALSQGEALTDETKISRRKLKCRRHTSFTIRRGAPSAQYRRGASKKRGRCLSPSTRGRSSWSIRGAANRKKCGSGSLQNAPGGHKNHRVVRLLFRIWRASTGFCAALTGQGTKRPPLGRISKYWRYKS